MTVNQILDQIPAERRTPAVLNLMLDAAALGPEHAGCLVDWVRENWPKLHHESPKCQCGVRVTFLCSICAKCLNLD